MPPLKRIKLKLWIITEIVGQLISGNEKKFSQQNTTLIFQKTQQKK
jgi:hypothetical protein